MVTHMDPLHRLRPINEEELEELSNERAATATAGPLAYDVYRIRDELVIEFDVPGIEPSQIDVDLEDRTLVVKICRDIERGDGVDVIATGRLHGQFSQRLFLGDHWDVRGLKAQTAHGVLYVRTPLLTQPMRRHVDVADQGTRSAPMPVNGAAELSSVRA